MKIINNGKLIADKIKFYDDIFSKTKGLMFSKPLKKREALILVANKEGILNTTIHMFFVFFPVDVVWLNSKKEVIDIRYNVKMFTPFIKPRKPARYVLELSRGIGNFFKIGDKVKIE